VWVQFRVRATPAITVALRWVQLGGDHIHGKEEDKGRGLKV
jgi:hypothetical protein